MHISNDYRNLVDQFKGKDIETIKDLVAKKAFQYHIAIENPEHDFNIGTIVRNANAFAASGVHIVGKRHWNKRGAMATEKYLQLYYHKSSSDFADWAKKERYPVIGIDNSPGCLWLHEQSLPAKAVYIFGQEGPGLSSEIESNCSYIIGIEQYGSTRSVNVGVASGIFMYQYSKQCLSQ